MTKEQWHEVININLSAAFKLSQLVIKSMIKQKWGRIVGISSIIGICGNVGQANYAASKAGIIGLHKSLALEFASRGITVNCIAPGFIESPMTEALADEQKEIMLKKIPIGNIGKPEDIANCVAFLTDEKATQLAISSGLPMLPIGIFFNIISFCSSANASVIGLSMNPGAIQLTVIPLEANSNAKDLCKPIVPAFDAA
jgi:short-subunit dehydrogenase